MDFFENIVEILESLIKVLNGDKNIVFVSFGNQDMKWNVMPHKIVKPP